MVCDNVCCLQSARELDLRTTVCVDSLYLDSSFVAAEIKHAAKY